MLGAAGAAGEPRVTSKTRAFCKTGLHATSHLRSGRAVWERGLSGPSHRGVSLPSVSLRIFQRCLGLLAMEAGRPTGAQGPLHAVSPHATRDLVGLVLSCPALRCGAQSVTAKAPLGKRPVAFSCHSREVHLLPLQLGRELCLYHHVYLPDPALPLPGLTAAESRARPLALSSAPVTRNPQHRMCL